MIDPGDEVIAFTTGWTISALKLKQILVTHAHIDHVGGALKLKRLTGAPILLNENDLPLLKMMETQAAWLGVATPETAPRMRACNDGLMVGLERYPAQVLHTPGHTQGSVCLHFAPLKLLIAGDTLFAGSIGRTDLPGRQFRADHRFDPVAAAGVARRDASASGPRPATTIGEERKSNPFCNLRESMLELTSYYYYIISSVLHQDKALNATPR